MQEYINTDRKLHRLSQIIAKVNRSLLLVQKDDSHTNLYFDAVDKRIIGRWVDSPAGQIILSLNLFSQAFEWLDKKQKILNNLAIHDTDLSALEKNISKYPASLNMNTEKIFEPLHFDIPEYEIEGLSNLKFSVEGLNSWVYFRKLANLACQNFLGFLQAESEVRIWPHHFDTGIYTLITDNLSMGFGLAMEDPMIDQPYFYISGYNEKNPLSYQNLKSLSRGRWETGKNWNGAVLPLGDISASSFTKAEDTSNTFIKETTAWFLNQ